LLAILGAVGEALTRSGSAMTATLLRIPSAGGGDAEFGLQQVLLVLGAVGLLLVLAGLVIYRIRSTRPK
jgi:beta-lactamase regulating signal transducer with metallopeptidase domain